MIADGGRRLAILGDLRNAISNEVRATVVAEFAHDLAKIPNHEIGSHLKPIWA